VGFIRALPPALLVAFRATLEEVQEASLLLHVTDITDPRHAEHDAEVVKVLKELGVAETPRLQVYNKIDQLAPEELKTLRVANGKKCFVSAKTGEGFEELLRRIDKEMPVDPVVRMNLRIPLSDGKTLALIHALGRVVESVVEESNLLLDADIPESLAPQLKKYSAELLRVGADSPVN
jgi:GTPase